MRIIFGAIISRHPFVAGSVWNRMQWVTGLRRLGHDVVYVEELRPKWCLDERGRACDVAHCINRLHFARTMKRFGLEDMSCQLYNGGESTTGMSLESLTEWANSADLLINQSGHVTSDVVLEAVKRRAYVDQDPVYTQLWHSEYGKDLNFARHDAFVTVGLNIGTPHSPIPTCGIPWRHTLPPVVPDFWTADDIADVADDAPFTTVASLAGYGDVSYAGEWYGSKYDHFRQLAALPQRASATFEVLLKDFRNDDEGVRALRAGGWQVRSLADMLSGFNLSEYRDYIHRSRGEIGIAKDAYVKGRSGWFSDRTACYLASGRPCVVQSTGLEHHLPSCEGFQTFRDLDEAVAGIEAVERNYGLARRAARDFAEEHLHYRKVLPQMLDGCFAASSRPVTSR